MDGLLHLVAQRLNVSYPICPPPPPQDPVAAAAAAAAAAADGPAPPAPPASVAEGPAPPASVDPELSALLQTDPHWRRTLFRCTFYLFLHFSVVARAAHADFLPPDADATAGNRRLTSAEYYRTVIQPFFAQHHLHSPLLHWALYVNYCGCPVWRRAGAAKRLALLRRVSQGHSWLETELAVWQEEWASLAPQTPQTSSPRKRT
jgi:hypothetical protein